MVDYYAQRAGAGLIISEAMGISRQALGWPYAPGIWSDAQMEGWIPITEAVHAAGGRIFAQLWHMGRLVHPSFNDGQPPVSASPTRNGGDVRTFTTAHTYEGRKPYEKARALELDEIPTLLSDYHAAAVRAREAGFDGVQLHAANGYLIDQFMRDSTNLRNDEYGGSIENRVRLLTEVTKTLVDAVGADRTSVRLSPNDSSNGCEDSDPRALFREAAKILDRFGLAFLELRASRPSSTFRPADYDLGPMMRELYSGPFVLNSDYGLEDATLALAEGQADAISFGRTFLANPDLPVRLAKNAPLNEIDADRLYTQGAEGYSDYPALHTN